MTAKTTGNQPGIEKCTEINKQKITGKSEKLGKISRTVAKNYLQQ